MNTISLLKLKCMFLTKWFKHSNLNLKDRKTKQSIPYILNICMYVTTIFMWKMLVVDIS